MSQRITPSRPDRRAHRRARHGAQFIVELGSFRNGSLSRRAYTGTGVLADLFISSSRGPVRHRDRGRGDILEAVHDGILVTGKATTTWQGACRRCLEEATGPLEVSFQELCVEQGDEETTYPLGAEELVLDPIVHDACILDLPLAPLCNEGCLGICPQCGTNLNLETCLCAVQISIRTLVRALLGLAGDDSNILADDDLGRTDGSSEEEDLQGKGPLPTGFGVGTARSGTQSRCPQCSHAKTPHVVCPNCGWYKGRQAIEVN